MFTPFRILTLGMLCLTSLAAQKTNVLLICIDDLRPELKCFGAEYIHSPNIDRLANEGRAFTRHYTNAPTCGASRYTLLTGRYGTANNHALFKRAKEHDVFETFDGDDSSYPDGLITTEALTQLSQLAQSEQPFFLTVGLIRPKMAPQNFTTTAPPTLKQTT
jgi:hypothetical protein